MAVRKVLRSHGIEYAVQVDHYVGVGILVDREGGRRVLDEDVQHPYPYVCEFGQCVDDVSGDPVTAFGKCR